MVNGSEISSSSTPFLPDAGEARKNTAPSGQLALMMAQQAMALGMVVQ